MQILLNIASTLIKLLSSVKYKAYFIIIIIIYVNAEYKATLL